VENPIGKKEEEENKSIENRRSVVLYNHIHLAGRQDRRIMWAFFLAAKLIIIIIIILASPAALEQWGHVTKYVHQVLLARVVSWGRGGGISIDLCPHPIKEQQQHVLWHLDWKLCDKDLIYPFGIGHIVILICDRFLNVQCTWVRQRDRARPSSQPAKGLWNIKRAILVHEFNLEPNC
jgi:hypothetical protein